VLDKTSLMWNIKIAIIGYIGITNNTANKITVNIDKLLKIIIYQ